MVRVIRVPRFEEGVSRFSGVGHAVAAAGVPAKSHALPPTLFEIEGLEQKQAADEVPAQPSGAQSTSAAWGAVAHLLHPGPQDQAVYSAAMLAFGASNSSLEHTAQVLARLGYTVRLHTSAGGSIHQLKHSYITATRIDRIIGQPAEWVIDPSFAQSFAVANPTRRYARILEAVPPVLVVPLPRLVRALLLLGAELTRCFQDKGVPLPPWRHVEAIASKYDAVSSVLVHPSGGLAPHAAEEAAAAAAGGPRAAAPAVAAAVVERKQHRDRQQLERVQLRLARLGLLQEQVAPSAASSCGTSPCKSNSTMLAESPSSILAASQTPPSARIMGKAALVSKAAPTQQKPSRFQPQRQAAGSLGCHLRSRRVVASAA